MCLKHTWGGQYHGSRDHEALVHASDSVVVNVDDELGRDFELAQELDDVKILI